MKSRGVIAIVGRPNVGKSTLFNALTRTRDALVDDQPGVTRDRIYGQVESTEAEDCFFWLVDTGGFETKGTYFQPFSENIVWQQTEYAIQEADAVVLLVDGRAGLHPHDEFLAGLLREKAKPVFVVVNKVDPSDSAELRSADFFALGFDSITAVSAAHQRGTAELREKLSVFLHGEGHISADTDRIAETAIALIGRPNVGKSSILNRLIGTDRSLVSSIAGTTRDAIDTVITYEGHRLRLIDTAGVRRRSRIEEKIESLSVLKSLRAIERADVCVLVVDAAQGFTDQEARLAMICADQHKTLILVINKWDLIENKTSNTARDYAADIKMRLKTLAYVPVIFVSCEHNLRVHLILREVLKVKDTYTRRVGTAELNKTLAAVVSEHTPALVRDHSKRIKFFYATQVSAKPPTIVIKCNLETEIQESYKRYMTNRFRELLGFDSVPLRLIFRGKEKKE